MDRQHSICFIGLKCYDLLVDNPVPRYLGGSEKSMVSLGKALATRGHDVSFVTYDHGQQSTVTRDGIKVIPSYSPDSGFPIVRFFVPRLTDLRKSMLESGANIFLQMGAASETGLVAAIRKTLRASLGIFVFCIASDSDCCKMAPAIVRRHELWLYRYGLSSADKIVAQTNKQREMLLTNYSEDSLVQTMPGTFHNGYRTSRSEVSGGGVGRILWVGRIDRFKRLEFLLDVAERLPNMIFDVVGEANITSAYAEAQKCRAQQIPNVLMHGKLSDSNTQNLFQKSGILCCTSTVEGFPTTFLEAWACGIPVVTTFDPDDIITKNKLGGMVETVDEMVSEIRKLEADNTLWKQVSSQCRQYFEDKHKPETAAIGFEKLFAEL